MVIIRLSLVRPLFGKRACYHGMAKILYTIHLHVWSSSLGPLAKLAMFTKARLSVQPLTDDEFDFIVKLEEEEEEEEKKGKSGKVKREK